MYYKYNRYSELMGEDFLHRNSLLLMNHYFSIYTAYVMVPKTYFNAHFSNPICSPQLFLFTCI